MTTFFPPPPAIPLVELANRTGCTLVNAQDGTKTVNSVAPVEDATPGALTFLTKPKYLSAVQNSSAAAVICHARHADKFPDHIAVMTSPEPYRAFGLAAAILFPSAMRPQPVFGEGISKAAHIHETALLEEGATVEAGAVIGRDVRIGADTYIGPNVTIGAGCHIGRDTAIAGNVSIVHSLIGDHVILQSGVRLGGDGFGFATGMTHQKIPQVGRVIIQDHVEIGANTCVDRGANRDTIIGEGTKIDCLVMVGHNVVIGRHCVIVGQVGLAGSCELEDYVVIGGQAGVSGHLKVGQRAQLAGRSGVVDDVPPGAKWGGAPARPVMHWIREVNRVRRDALSDKDTQT
ncbi:MAG: UDP-3-O-(3-hydroxymyristoyl)glucosamine N-acyltransferase [Pseudomonadota bacterium]